MSISCKSSDLRKTNIDVFGFPTICAACDCFTPHVLMASMLSFFGVGQGYVSENAALSLTLWKRGHVFFS